MMVLSIRKSAIAISLTLASTLPALAQSVPAKLLTQASPQPFLTVRRCPDPATHQIDFQIIRRVTQFRGRIRVTGVVHNVGRATYNSNPRQQSILLYESSRLVAQRQFQNLTPGQEVRVTFVRDWDASSPAEGEFPPTYKLMIGYDPDIAIDGNPRNDDCNLSNNRRQRSGADINALFQ